MASASIAFETPDTFTGARPSGSRPIDLVHLANQTMGDKLLEIEVLQLFARQARACLREMTASDADGVKSAAHKLKGASSAIGAFQVFNAAERLEVAPLDPALLASVASSVLDAENFILKLSR